MIPNHQENQNIKENEIVPDYVIGDKTEMFVLTGIISPLAYIV